MTECSTQVGFSFPHSPRIRVSFDDGRLTSDAGVLLVRQADQQTGLTAALAGALHEWRNPLLAEHSLHDLVRERVFAIAQGYEDCNDARELRDDPLFKACSDRGADGSALASQPTLSRFEHQSLTDENMKEARLVLVRHLVSRWKRTGAPRRLVLDLDSTDDPTHGQQPFAFFNGYYDTHCYQQLFIYTADGDLLWAKLVSGTANTRLWGLEGLKEVASELRAAFPRLRLTIRADNGFACPDLYDWCEDHGLDYAVNCGTHKVFCDRTAELVKRAETLFSAGGETAPVQVFGEFKHQADSWRQERRVVAKAARTLVGPDQRFIATSLKGAPDQVYGFYGGRGQMENWIKDTKLDVASDRLSCTTFLANELRLLLYAVAYQMLHEIRRVAPEHLRHARLSTLRLRLLRVAGHLKHSARRLCIRISEYFPARDDWLATAAALGV